MNNDEDTSAVIFGVILLILLMPFSAAWRGLVLSELWGWFVVPLGLEPIGIAHAIGLSLAVGMFAQAKSKDNEDKPFMHQVIVAVLSAAIGPAFVWLMGAIIHSFM
ncbi:MAG: hypothetical protein ACYTEQ_25955 [Planctomycetota bacterium]|jgi:hypothetical protein